MYSYPHKTAYRPLPGVFLKDYMSFLEGQGHGLYLHLPFCRTKCGYCNLFSVTGQKSGQIDRYLEAVERQSRQYQELLRPRQTTFSDLVIGGGTPLLLTDKQLEHMFCMLKELFVLETGAQIVTETSPNETTREKLEVLRQAGVTRISMGVAGPDQRTWFSLRECGLYLWDPRSDRRESSGLPEGGSDL